LLIAVYIIIIIMMLLSALFVGISMANRGVTTRLSLEHDKMQESIVIGGPGGIELEGTSAKAIRVNNTGAITVRIRALYINHIFIDDPSTFEGDSYIKPSETKWIQLTGINYEENKKAIWTVTTERGTSSSVKGEWLIKGPPNEFNEPDKILFGPFELLFESFYWREDGSTQWNPGWSIPTSTKNVMWKVNIRNVDNQAITITKDSSFLLIANDEIPNNLLSWYLITDQTGTITIQPGQSIEVIYGPRAPGGKQLENMSFQSGYTCLNFLIFTGTYANGKPLAQTIPFQAILVTPSK
jgi:hypothetical protein